MSLGHPVYLDGVVPCLDLRYASCRALHFFSRDLLYISSLALSLLI